MSQKKKKKKKICRVSFSFYPAPRLRWSTQGARYVSKEVVSSGFIFAPRVRVAGRSVGSVGVMTWHVAKTTNIFHHHSSWKRPKGTNDSKAPSSRIWFILFIQKAPPVSSNYAVSSASTGALFNISLLNSSSKLTWKTQAICTQNTGLIYLNYIFLSKLMYNLRFSHHGLQ